MKHSIFEIREEYNRLDALCGVDTSSIDLHISKRAIRQYGCCRHKYNVKSGSYEPYAIYITEFILECDSAFWDCIRHEYAHALVTLRDGRNHGHDAVWKKACLEVGCKAERLCIDDEADRKSAAIRKKRIKYEVKCSECGRTYCYTRVGNIVQSIRAGHKCVCCCGNANLSLIEF